jgi:hypothetical protein
MMLPPPGERGGLPPISRRGLASNGKTRISYENQIIQIVFENVFCIIMMNAAPVGRPRGGFNDNIINLFALPCLGENLMQGTLAILWIFMVPV